MRMNEKYKLAIVIAVFTLLFAGIGTLAWFKIGERSRFNLELANFQTEEQAAREKIAQIPGLMEERAKLVETIDRYAEILPPEEHAEHTAFVNIIDSYRRDTQILIQKAEYVPVKEDESSKRSFVRHRYRFKLLGSVPDFLAFLGKVENHKRFMKIDAFNIRPFGSTGQINKSLATRNDSAELDRAANPLKEIDLTVSTYTYVKGTDSKRS